MVIKITQIAYDRIKQIFDRKYGGRTHGAFRPPAGVPKPRNIAIDGRNGGEGTASLPAPPAGVPKPSKYGGRSEKKKRGALSSRTATPTGK